MTVYVALLRAVNVGGTGKLPMTELKSMCETSGFTEVKTYIASGNVVFKSALSAEKVQGLLEARLKAYAGKPVGLHVRSAREMTAILAGNPFPRAAPNRTVAIFLFEPPPTDTIKKTVGWNGEEIILGLREIYVHYGEGMGNSKLRIPAASEGTARNMNTVAKLAAMAGEL